MIKKSAGKHPNWLSRASPATESNGDAKGKGKGDDTGKGKTLINSCAVPITCVLQGREHLHGRTARSLAISAGSQAMMPPIVG